MDWLIIIGEGVLRVAGPLLASGGLFYFIELTSQPGNSRRD